jgi:hypothetical protein
MGGEGRRVLRRNQKLLYILLGELIMDIELRQLSVNDDIDIYNILQEIPKDENGYEKSSFRR